MAALTYQFNDRRQGWIYTTESNAANYLPIQHTDIPVSGDLLKKELTITVAGDRADEEPWAGWLSAAENLGEVSLEISASEIINRGLLVSISETIYRGLLVSVSSSDQEIGLQFTDRYRVRRGVRRRFQRNCNFQLYDRDTCKAQSVSFSETRAIDGISGKTITISAPPTDLADYVHGQFIHRGSNRYWIVAVTPADGTVTTSVPVLNAQIGEDIVIVKGCNKTVDHCTNRFSNIRNYGGFPHLPDSTPFGQTFGNRDR